MKADEVREKYLDFFKVSPRNHKVIPAAPLVPVGDSTSLFTSSGMQPLVPYLMGEDHPSGERLVNSQPSIRVQDIEEVGDSRHTTFFEMLGNWSLNDNYFKGKQLHWIFQFLTDKEEGLGLDPKKLYVSVFDGDEGFKVMKDGKPQNLYIDMESVSIWKEIFEKVGIECEVANISSKVKPDISKGRIFYYGADKNWWSRSGTPKQMPVGEIGGPDSEIFYDFGEKHEFHKNSEWKDIPCHPNCDCGRFLEIGNSVFMQYKKIDEKTFEELPNKNVDFGGGLERMTAATTGNPDIFKIDIFQKIVDRIRKLYFRGIYDSSTLTPYYPVEGIFENVNDQSNRRIEVKKAIRVIADHMRAAVFLVDQGVEPSNKLQGYVLRKLVRRSLVKLNKLGKSNEHDIESIVEVIIEAYEESPYLKNKNKEDIVTELGAEAFKFSASMDRGMKKLEKAEYNQLNALLAFNLFQSDGFPFEVSRELMKSRGVVVDRKEFNHILERHKELSRKASAGMFKGGLADTSEETTRLHTATHLLNWALRTVLGDHVIQKGSNITSERLRFDFSNEGKLSDSELREVENLINEKIEASLPVNFEIMSRGKAEGTGAIHAFGEKYGENVKIYYIGNDLQSAVSKEFCGGPHVKNTKDIGRVTITKQKKIGTGLMRIYAEAK